MLDRKFAVIGLRAHSGWAAAVVLKGPVDSPSVVLRRKVVLVNSGAALAKQPYHAAENLPIRQASALIARSHAEALSLATAAIQEIKEHAAAQGHLIGACALLLASGRPLPVLAAILKSHALIHTAEGEHFREVLRGAAREQGLAMFEVRERDAASRAQSDLGISSGELPAILKQLGQPLGPPWTQDEKLGALAAWLAMQSIP